jgi:hypothetical protein
MLGNVLKFPVKQGITGKTGFLALTPTLSEFATRERGILAE